MDGEFNCLTRAAEQLVCHRHAGRKAAAFLRDWHAVETARLMAVRRVRLAQRALRAVGWRRHHAASGGYATRIAVTLCFCTPRIKKLARGRTAASGTAAQTLVVERSSARPLWRAESVSRETIVPHLLPAAQIHIRPRCAQLRGRRVAARCATLRKPEQAPSCTPHSPVRRRPFWTTSGAAPGAATPKKGIRLAILLVRSCAGCKARCHWAREVSTKDLPSTATGIGSSAPAPGPHDEHVYARGSTQTVA